MSIRYPLLLSLAGLLLSTSAAKAQLIVDRLDRPKELEKAIVGDPKEEDYGAMPYGEHHILFESSREHTARTPRDPVTHKPIPGLFLMDLRDFSVAPYRGNIAIKNLKYYKGPGALLPDSSGLILNHSKQKVSADGNIGMTISFIPFNGDGGSKVLPFIDDQYNYDHPYFDEASYTLYFASNMGGNYDIYQSTLALDGSWSAPQPVAFVNTDANEVFPTINGNVMNFSRGTKNYGLQLYSADMTKKTVELMEINGRGDDFGLLVVNDTCALLSQSKRKKSVANFTVYKTTPPASARKNNVAPQETDTEEWDQADLFAGMDPADAIAMQDSIDAYNMAQAAGASEARGESYDSYEESFDGGGSDQGANTWVTDNSPSAGTTNGYSVIVGGFISRKLANQFLEDIRPWAPQVFLSRHNDKYYVVHSVHGSFSSAKEVRGGIRDQGNRAWILPGRLGRM